MTDRRVNKNNYLFNIRSTTLLSKLNNDTRTDNNIISQGCVVHVLYSVSFLNVSHTKYYRTESNIRSGE